MTELRSAPHERLGVSVESIMLNVVLALLPIALFSIWLYGLSALALLITSVVVCLATERVFNRLSGQSSTLSDWSAMITGILLALVLPPSFPLWMTAVAAVVAMGLGKILFGGLGMNVFNPALVGRAFVQAAFPSAIATWVPSYAPNRFHEFIPTTLTPPLMIPPDITAWVKAVSADAFTGATPLAMWKFQHQLTAPEDLILGIATASVGETSAMLILVCGLYLALRGMLDWRIPVGMMGSAVILASAFHLYNPDFFPPPVFVLLSGGLMLGAMFMATDMATSPVTPLAVWTYAILIGVVTVLIRYFGGLSEGVMYAILFGNALAPLLDRSLPTRVFGRRKPWRVGS